MSGGQRLLGELVFAMGTPNVYFIVINALATSVVLYVVYKSIAADAFKRKLKFNIGSFLGIFIVMGVVYGLLYAATGWGIMILLFLFTCFLLAAFVPIASCEGILSFHGACKRSCGQ
ncbi:MAG: hypothetical protein WDO15_28170 [Bacteroidota bacterium]